MMLRPYQTEAMIHADTKLSQHVSTLIEMATGLGKTVVFVHFADQWPGRVLIIAHRDELIRQAAEKVHLITGRPAGIEMGRERVTEDFWDSKIVVGSIQTLARANRRERFKPDHFSLIVIDEGHHAVASTYREVLDYFRNAKKLFVTATPKRADQIGLEHVCDSVAFQYGIEAAIDDGWLVPIRQTVVKVDDLDFSRARTMAGDFNQHDLETILMAEKPLHEMTSSAHEIIGTRQALWFCVSVAQAKACASVLARYPHNGVHFLCGETPAEERVQVVESYRRGKIQHLLNCALFLEGFDAPSTSAIVMARPTKSLSLYMQVIGRGTRPLPGIVDGPETPQERQTAIASSAKPDMQVIDFAGNAGKHKIIQALDVLGGKYGPEILEEARELSECEVGANDIRELLERAKAEHELMMQEAERLKTITAKAKYRTYEVDPFTANYRGAASANQCSKKQAGLICYLSRNTPSGKRWAFDEAMSLTSRQASGVINKLKQETGL